MLDDATRQSYICTLELKKDSIIFRDLWKYFIHKEKE